jgi:hypothetical protein
MKPAWRLTLQTSSIPPRWGRGPLDPDLGVIFAYRRSIVCGSMKLARRLVIDTVKSTTV